MSSSNNCGEFIELLDAYHDGELEADQLFAVEAHVANCADCSLTLKEISSMVSGLQSLIKVQFEAEPQFDFLLADAPVDNFYSVSDQCKPTFELLDAYNDNELDANEIESVAKHLANCSDCSGHLAAIRRLVADLSNLPALRPSRDIVEHIDFASLNCGQIQEGGCAGISELLDGYYDGELSSQEKLLVEQHFEICVDCPPKLQQIRKVADDLSSLPRLKPQRNIIEILELNPVTTADSADLAIVSSKANLLPFNRSVKIGICTAAAAAVAMIFAFTFKPVEIAQVRPDPNSAIEMKAALTASNSGLNEEKTPDSVESPKAAFIEDSNDQAAIKKQNNELLEEQIQRPDKSARKLDEIAKLPNDSSVFPAVRHEAITVDVPRAIDNAEVAVMPESDNGACADALGIGTDEDGLYDIKI